MGRILAQLLACYLVILTLYPCGDDVIEAIYASQPTVSATHTHSGSEPATDFCSPLCLCTCCGVSVQLAEVHPFEMFEETRQILDKFSALTVSSPLSFPKAIFHPPKG
ncbi:MAG: hypothetical protein RIG62_18700 [Cyclobacteriaceae bacterium]